MKMVLRKNKIFICLLVFLFALATVVMLSCNEDADVHITWSDPDGQLIAFEKHSSDYDPTQRELPADGDGWHYTEWRVIKNGNKVFCTAVRVPIIKVVWEDSDGNAIEIKYLPENEIKADLVALPQDTDEWHYKGWSEEQSTNSTVFVLQKLGKTHYTWKDASGEIIKEQILLEGEELVQVELPTNTDKWNYVDWITETVGNKVTNTISRLPQKSYFAGNVFQIILKDETGKAISSGSGFVINDEGWFITNNHVMEGCSNAVAFFDITDSENGRLYTELKVIGGIYNNSDQDIFIGKLEGYEKIKNHYKKISFTEEYSKDENAYTVGYPHSSVSMEINSGIILEEYSDIFDKINGVYYILSDSYIAPGSSGGILINDAFEVIGITTIGWYADEEKEIYIAGGSVPTFVFKTQLGELDATKLKTLKEIYK